jgi:GNAT superfamily N-acetyltransferase
MTIAAFVLRVNPLVTNEQINDLFAAAWPNHIASDFQQVLGHSLLYVCAYVDERMVGFVNMAWDGGIHAFLLDTTVHPDFQRQGIGVQLVQTAVQEARNRGIEWVHVDYEPHLRKFYERCGFKRTEAGLIDLTK